MIIDHKILLSCILITLGFLTELVGQLDTLHYIPPLHSRLSGQIQDHYVYLSTPEATPFAVTVRDGSGNDIPGSPFAISNAAPLTIFIGNGQIPSTELMVDYSQLNQVLSDKGLILSAKDPFYANARYRSAAQAEALTAKGLASAGTEFRVGMMPIPSENSFRNFVVGIMALEDGTTVDISDYDPGVVFHGPNQITSDNLSLDLNAGESYVLSGYSNVVANREGMIGALVESNKPIVINSGNMCGTIGPASGGQDFGLDQIAPINKMGNNYIIVEGQGIPAQERPMVVAHYDNTEVFLNGSGSPVTTLQAGEFFLIDNNEYSGSLHRNMYIYVSEPAYAYQFLAGSASHVTPGMNFMPPVDCSLPNEVDLIPEIERIGSTVYNGGIFVITETGSTLTLNGSPQAGAQSVTGNPDWETYKILGLTGDVAINSTGGIAVGLYGQSGSAGFAGFYAGFSSVLDVITSNDTSFCAPQLGVVTISAEADGGTGPYIYEWNQGLGSGQQHVVSPNITTEYIVTVTDIVSCTSTDKIIIEINEPPLLEMTSDETICNGETVTVGVEVNGAEEPLDYTWNEGLGNSPSHNVSPGVSTLYLITVTDGNGCSSTGNINIEVNPNPSVEIQGDEIVCEGSNAFLDAGDGFISYNWNTGASSQSISPGSTGLYLVTVTDVNDCTDTDSFNFEISSNPIVVAGDDQSICTGENTILFGAAFSGVEPYSYVWDQGLGEGESQFITPDETTTYTLTVIDGLGCIGLDNVTVIVNPEAEVEISGDAELCEGFNSIIDAGEGYETYEWSTGENTQLIDVSSSGFYTVTITDENGCSAFDIFEVIVADSLQPVVTGDLTICNGQSNILDAGDLYSSYLWNTGDTTNTISIGDAGIYTLTVTNNAGCSGSTLVNAQLFESPEIDMIEQSSICQGESLEINATITSGQGPFNFNWNDVNLSGDSFSVSPTQNVVYELTVIDINGCIDSASLEIIVNENPVLTAADNQVVCLGDSILLTAQGLGGNAPYVYEWNQSLGMGQNHQILTTSTTSYQVSITDAEGCSDIDSMEVFVTPGIDGTISGVTEFCFGNSTQLSVSQEYSSYQWNTGETSSNIVIDVAGNYAVTIYDEFGCETQEETDVTVLDSLSPEIVSANSFCTGESLSLTVEGSYQNYSWSTGETSNSIEVSVGGTYLIHVMNDDGCNGQDEITIIENENPLIQSMNPIEICEGESALVSASVSNGTGPYSYFWDHSLGGGMQHIVTPTTSTTYNLTVTDNNGCTTESDLPVLVRPQPIASTQHLKEICINDVLEIQYTGTANAGNQFTWDFEGTSNISGNGMGPYFLEYPDAGSYSIEVIVDLEGCTDSVSSNVIIYPVSNTLEEVEACDSYSWNGEEYFESGMYTIATSNVYGCDSIARLALEINPSYHSSIETIVCSEAETGVNNILLSSTYGCDSMITEIYTLAPEITVSLGGDINIKYGEIVNIEAQVGGMVVAIDSIYWEGIDGMDCPECLTQSFVAEDRTIVTIYVLDENGCIYSDEVNIRVILSTDLFVPNVFSPNKDGINDYFFLQGNPEKIDRINTMYVFDRWGNILFEAQDIPANDPEKGWDGTYQGNHVNPAVFVWFAEVKLDDGSTRILKGDVTLQR